MHKIILSDTLLREMSEALNSVASKWYNIGLKLDLAGDELHHIESDLRASPTAVNHEKYLRDMLSVRLKVKELTWKQVVEALRKLSENDLAEKLAEEHSKLSRTLVELQLCNL